MKTILLSKTRRLKLALLIVMTATTLVSHSQQLVFSNSSHESGSPAAGTDGAIYRFPSVANNVDALVKINGRSSSLVTLTSIDVTNAGYDKAFQPQISYNNGTVASAQSWWMEFKVTFVNKNTTTPVNLTNVYATEVDLDGDNSKLHEVASFYSPSSFILENPTNLSVSNLTQMLLGILTNVGKTFDGVVADHNGIDTFATNLMVTTQYNNINSFTYRAGGSTTGASSKTDRQYSVYFKNFNYTAPIITLPITLESFNAVLNNNKADLTWTTAQEMNVSHFVIERSFDGKNFTDAGNVSAYGNSFDRKNYSFSDNLANTSQTVIYYRLRSVDNDGKSQLSAIRIIRIGKQGELVKMVTYPNPATSELRITVPANWQNREVLVEVFNPNGQQVKAIKDNNASQTETIAINDLATGFYFIKATCGNESAQQKFIKN
jgi:hypothetical protein